MELSLHEQVLRLLVALVLGCLVGFERERFGHAAGLRTHAMVCVGSALFLLVSAYGFADFSTLPGASLDPTRIAAQVVSGIGFVGAGAIIVQRNQVRGLTTAATLWTVAAIGLATGAGMYLAAVAGTIASLLVLYPLKYVEEYLVHGGRRAAPSGGHTQARQASILTRSEPARRYRRRNS